MILLSSLAAAAILAAPPAPAGGLAPEQPGAAATAVSCIDVRRTGSILPMRVCHTAAEWASLRATERDICGPATTTAHGHCDVQLTSNGPQATIRTRE